MTAPKRRNLPPWSTLVQEVLAVEHGAHRLNVSVIEVAGVWVGAAVMAPIGTVTKDPRDALDRVFSDHSHDTLPTNKTRAAAVRQAEAYARAWLKGGVRAARCACGLIEDKAAE